MQMESINLNQWRDENVKSDYLMKLFFTRFVTDEALIES